MALKYALFNHVSMLGTENLLKLINNVFGKRILPDSRYLIEKICNSKEKMTLHAMCPVCYDYLGEFKELGDIVICKICDTSVDTSNPSNICFFAYINPSSDIQDILKLYEKYYEYVISNRTHEKGHYRDIYDGKMYRDFVKTLSNTDKHQYVTALFNTDGAPVFESSTFSIWPIYIILNEIPPEVRMKNVIVSGLFFGPKKPEMNLFLDVFVKNINNLSTNGIPCNINCTKKNIKLFCLVAVVDTVARAPMNGTTQFNGKYGCDWCLHPGQYFGGSMRYPFLN